MILTLQAKLIAATVVFLALCGAVYGVISHERSIGAMREQAKIAEATIQQQRKDASETASRLSKQQEIVNAAQAQAASAAVDMAATRRADNALRMQLAAFRASYARAANSAASSAIPTVQGDDPLGVLADVLGRIDERAELLANIADQRRIRAIGCERSYESLAPSGNLH